MILDKFRRNRKDKVKKKVSKRTKLKRISIVLSSLTFLLILYLIVVFSNNSFIKKWRTIYIETAMTTTSHKWLATWFFPDFIIDDVMGSRRRTLQMQIDAKSEWTQYLEEEEKKKEQEENVVKDEKTLFYEKYWELNSDSFKSYVEQNPSIMDGGYDNILYEDIDFNNGLKTSNGDNILVVDTANNLLIVGVKGEGYVGKMAIAKNPEQVDMVIATTLGNYGEEAISFNQRFDAAVTINASGFVDVGGCGSGGHIRGSLIRDGIEMGKPMGGTWKFFGFKKDNRMYVNNYNDVDVSEYRWAIEFYPALIINGASVVDGTAGMGIQPRSAVGQAANGDFFMLVIDGRQAFYSYGTTVAECANILTRYHAVQAMNIDGGSSSVMIYKGAQITRSSSQSGRGRYMPNAFIIKKAAYVN